MPFKFRRNESRHMVTSWRLYKSHSYHVFSTIINEDNRRIGRKVLPRKRNACLDVTENLSPKLWICLWNFQEKRKCHWGSESQYLNKLTSSFTWINDTTTSNFTVTIWNCSHQIKGLCIYGSVDGWKLSPAFTSSDL